MSSTSPRSSYEDQSKRDIPSFIEPRPPVILHPFMRTRPEKGTNLMDLLEDSEYEEPDLLKVYLRLKPCNVASKLYEVRSERTLITSLDTTTAGHGRRTQHNVSKMYTFSHIFGPDSTQKEIFEQVVKDNLKRLPVGNSFTLLTYGASGSGKTFTLMGTVAAPGLVPRSLEYVFKVVDAAQRPVYKPDERGTDQLSYVEQEYELRWVRQLRQISAPVRDKYRRMSAQLGGDLTVSGIDLANRRSHYVWVSFIEIYNEGIYDLLAAGDKRSSQKLAIREDSTGNVYVKGATQAFVRSGEEAYDVLVAGKHNLQVAATGIHAQSSRSHCIFTITMLTETEGGGMRSACVRLCDLAGCERAARTRNTGARMQESRAINSSLHVLERCLRMLRRKRTATTLVPYRESKLTRLLGAGLSGTRGEAVSMVVTLNPSPEYANETRHVLQLAAVAKDIQINDTLSTLSEYPSTLESTQDATIGYNAIEIMKLRADNERLLFELEQAQARIEELKAGMEQCKADNEKAQWLVFKESEAMYKEFYEAQLAAMRTKMHEMVEEYESRLSQLESRPSRGSSLSTDYQKQISQLMTDNAILQEKLSAERLARATAEQEVQHLRACIEERDDKPDDPTSGTEDVVSLTDSDTDSDGDCEDNPYNQSLEPTIRKEDINRSRMLKKSFMIAEHQNSFNRNSDESDLETSLDSIRDNDKTNDSNISDRFNESVVISTVKKGNNLIRSTFVVSQNDDTAMNTETSHTRPHSRDTFCVTNSEDHESSKDVSEEQIAMNDKDSDVPQTQRPLSRDTFCVTNSEDHETSKDVSQERIAMNDKDSDVPQTQRPLSRDTFCVTNSEDNETSKDVSQEQIAINDKDRDIIKTKRPLSRETYYVTKAKSLNASKEQIPNSFKISQHQTVPNQIKTETIKTQRPLSRETYCVASSESLNISNDSKLQDHAIKNSSNIDIVEFQETNKRTTSLKSDTIKDLNVSKGYKLNREDENSGLLKNEMVEDCNVSQDIKLQNQEFHKSNIVDSVKFLNISENKDLPEKNDIPKLLKHDIAKIPNESLRVEKKTDISAKSKVLPNTFVKKLIDNIKQSTESNESLVQFERLEMEAKLLDTDKKRVTGEFYNIKLKKEHKKFFDEDYDVDCPKAPATVIKNKDKKIFFENPKEEELKPIEKKSSFENFNTDSRINDSKTKEVNDYRSPSIVKDDVTTDFRPSIVKKLLGKNITKSRGVDSCDLFADFDSPRDHNKIETNLTNSTTNNITKEIDRKSIDKNVISDVVDIKEVNNSKNISIEILEKKPIHVITIESSVDLDENGKIMENTKMDYTVEKDGNKLHETLFIDKSQLQENSTKGNNTTVEFENIFKDITAPRATEFDLLISHDSSKSGTDKLETTQDSETEKCKYNLRRKTKFEMPKTERKRRTKKVLEGEVLLESQSKCESSKKPTRKNLRLRRQKHVSDADTERDKLVDIVNLQTEFSDVTMDLPVPVKITKDIPSPEKLENDENTSPVLGIRSCPAKSITRSRRKLFTPRAEPLDESAGGTGDSDQRVRVPRPSYHRPRARRKL